MADPALTLKHNLFLADGVWRLQVWVSDAEEIPPEVFLVRTLPIMPGTVQTQTYARVCTYADLLLYETTSSEHTQWFRTRAVDLKFTTSTDALDTWTELVEGADALCADVVATTAAESVTVEHVYHDLTLTITTKASPNGTALVRFTLTHPTADPALFLVTKSADLDPATNPTVDELLAVASLEDVATYATTPIYPGIYRQAQVWFATPGGAKLTKVVDALKTDIQAIAVLLTDDAASTTETVMAELTAGTTVYSGDPFTI
jgi:hypothetical protein